jgi:Tfp pilus assembly protein PilF
VREAALGPDHPLTAVTLTNLGLLDLSRGDFAGATRHFERALDNQRKAFGADQPAMLNTLVAYRALLEAEGRTADAGAIQSRLDALAAAAAAKGGKLPKEPVVRLPPG